MPTNSLATRSVAGKARSYTHELLATKMTNAGVEDADDYSGRDKASVSGVSSRKRSGSQALLARQPCSTFSMYEASPLDPVSQFPQKLSKQPSYTHMQPLHIC